MDRYLNNLAAKSPVPGGGSAAALVGALGMSLLCMAARYLAGKKDVKGSRAKLTEIIKFADRSRRRLRKLMREDEMAYLQLSRAIKKRGRRDLSRLYRRAADVPLEVSTILAKGAVRCSELSVYCRSAIASDVAESVILMEAGFLSACLNIGVNLAGIKSSSYLRKAKNTILKNQSAIRNAKRKTFKKLKRRLT